MTTHRYHSRGYYITRRYVRLSLALSVIVLWLGAMMTLSRGDSTYSCDGSTVVAVYGDTLWSLAQQHCTGHIGVAVDTLYSTYSELSHGEAISFDI
ncbi:hypothetical protein UFOVP658_79 [uncultured Caudovirales phage]|uniref:LysM domain-containing protein n=1 Tax=uncultured Caudovirales phage TaxID=2100421 RepID=A0A6J5NCI7_9CAUD|nr:hypothetical protein UFOVP658_79 [uncultured Caudovirales phage]